MLENPSLITRIVVGKTAGFLIGLVGFILLPYIFPDASGLLRWGILLWYVTVGAFIAICGVLTYHPLLKISMPWWVQAPFLGAWMNFVLVFFAYDAIQGVMSSMFTGSSPFWFVVDGAIIGFIIGYFATRFGGQGKETVAVISG